MHSWCASVSQLLGIGMFLVQLDLSFQGCQSLMAELAKVQAFECHERGLITLMPPREGFAMFVMGKSRWCDNGNVVQDLI